jgi:hypothetical protein
MILFDQSLQHYNSFISVQLNIKPNDWFKQITYGYRLLDLPIQDSFLITGISIRGWQKKRFPERAHFWRGMLGIKIDGVKVCWSPVALFCSRKRCFPVEPHIMIVGSKRTEIFIDMAEPTRAKKTRTVHFILHGIKIVNSTIIR